MVMASRPGAGCRMGACETTPPASTSPGETTQPASSTTPQIPEGSSSPPIIGRRLPASSSFVLAATRLRALQLDPGPRDGTNRQRQGKATTTVIPQPGGPRATGHQVRQPRLLTARAPMGAILWSPLTESNRRPSPYHLKFPRFTARRALPAGRWQALIWFCPGVRHLRPLRRSRPQRSIESHASAGSAPPLRSSAWLGNC